MADKHPLVTELRSRRTALGWSLAEVGRRCGIDDKFLGDWERGIGSPRLDAAERWSAAVGLRLTFAPAESEARSGLQIDWERHCVTVDGTPVRLTPMEWKGLERLAWVPGEVVTHQALYRHLYGDDRPFRAQSTAIRVLITKLRRLLPLHIEARWGQGYVVSGLMPSHPLPNSAGSTAPASALAEIQDARPALAAAADPDIIDLSASGLSSRVAAAPARPALRRTEELGVIERFLAERGVTRCPDASTIERSPLPTLVWDKMKRKWVRPQMSSGGAG